MNFLIVKLNIIFNLLYTRMIIITILNNSKFFWNSTDSFGRFSFGRAFETRVSRPSGAWAM